ncbi:unnamed protein product [Cuscuta campestris]|uniref:Uncharacterized protein n=1 Tax=Cuscuta campestris TaxID=132261 RepID=A0A484L6L5_9ASTE|nr:unnamed protein product [Cuscuta campestris]
MEIGSRDRRGFPIAIPDNFKLRLEEDFEATLFGLLTIGDSRRSCVFTSLIADPDDPIGFRDSASVSDREASRDPQTRRLVRVNSRV